jgi:hypothetical protein
MSLKMGLSRFTDTLLIRKGLLLRSGHSQLRLRPRRSILGRYTRSSQPRPLALFNSREETAAAPARPGLRLAQASAIPGSGSWRFAERRRILRSDTHRMRTLLGYSVSSITSTALGRCQHVLPLRQEDGALKSFARPERPTGATWAPGSRRRHTRWGGVFSPPVARLVAIVGGASSSRQLAQA